MFTFSALFAVVSLLSLALDSSSTTSSSPSRVVKSVLFKLGIKIQSAGGGLGGGICKRVFSSCLRKANFAAACLLAEFSLEVDIEVVVVIG